MKKTESQLLLVIGCEGGRIELYCQFDSSGQAIYSAHSFGSGGLNEVAHETDLSSSSKRHARKKELPKFATIGDALAATGLKNQWVAFHLLEIHADYRDEVLDLRKKILSTAEIILREISARNEDSWSTSIKTAYGQMTQIEH